MMLMMMIVRCFCFLRIAIFIIDAVIMPLIVVFVRQKRAEERERVLL